MFSFLHSSTLTSIHDHWKTIAFTRWTFVSKVMSLLLNMLSRLVITFLPRSKCLLISWLQFPSAVMWSHYLMANRWGNSANSGWLYFGGSKITADGDYILLERKFMTNLDSILKSRDITLSTKFHLVKAMVFPVVMYGCESWTIKKAEHRRIDAFELWCWRRLLRVPWTARRSNQSILKEISSGCPLEGLMLKLKLQYFGHLMRRAD